MNPKVAPATQAPNREQAVKDLVAIGLTEAQARNLVASVQPRAVAGAAQMVDWPYVLCTTEGCLSDHGGGVFKDEKGNDFLKLAQAEAPEGGCTGEIVIMQVPADANGNVTSFGPLVVKTSSLAPSPKTVDTTARPIAAGSKAAPKTGKLADDFPGKAALEAAGYGTYGKVRALVEDDDKFADVPGIGDATAAKIKAALAT